MDASPTKADAFAALWALWGPALADLHAKGQLPAVTSDSGREAA